MENAYATLLDAQLPRDPGSSAWARRLLEAHVLERLDETNGERARVIVSELVANALSHGRGEIHLRVDDGRDRVRMEVSDEGKGCTIAIRDRADPADGGFGLRIIELLASDWGAEGSQVWAELPAADQPQVAANTR